MSNVMLDLETLGIKPGCIILSIAAVVFDPHGSSTGPEFYRNVSCVGTGLTADPRTVQWWSEQSEEARACLEKDKIPLLTALFDFDAWFTANSGEQIWCQGASFDAPILEAAYQALNMQAPWKFWNIRDTRTVYDVCDFDPYTMNRAGTYHNALDDCKHQVKCVQEALSFDREKFFQKLFSYIPFDDREHALNTLNRMMKNVRS